MADVTLRDPVEVMREPAHRVSPRARVLWAVHALVGGLVELVPLGAWWWLDPDRRWLSTWLLVAAAALTLLTMAVRPLWSYAVHRWEATPEAVVTRTGWLSTRWRVAPISRVQTVDVERGPVARLLGLATVTVTTASSAGAVELEGLDLATAERLVADLTRVTAQTVGDAT